MRLAIADPPYPPHFAERRDGPDSPIRITMRSRARRDRSLDQCQACTWVEKRNYVGGTYRDWTPCEEHT